MFSPWHHLLIRQQWALLPKLPQGGQNQFHSFSEWLQTHTVFPSLPLEALHEPKDFHVPVWILLLHFVHNESSIVWPPDEICMTPGCDQLVLNDAIIHSFFCSFTKHAQCLPLISHSPKEKDMHLLPRSSAFSGGVSLQMLTIPNSDCTASWILGPTGYPLQYALASIASTLHSMCLYK